MIEPECECCLRWTTTFHLFLLFILTVNFRSELDTSFKIMPLHDSLNGKFAKIKQCMLRLLL